MTEKELSKYYKLKREAEDLEVRIKEFDDGISSIKIKDIITSGGGSHSSIQEKLVQLKDQWYEKRVSALEEYLKIESYINNVDDPEIRLIMRLRFLDLMNWEKIGERTYQDRTSVSRKLRKYLKGE